jgi:UrcA family protein
MLKELTINTIFHRHDAWMQADERKSVRRAPAPFGVAISLFVAAVTCAFDALAVAPAADPVLSEQAVAVKVSDLDLTTNSGVSTAKHRITKAARQACNFTTAMGD